MAGTERWTLEHHGRTHVVAVDPKGLGRRISWHVDGEPVVERSTWDDTVRLVPDDAEGMGAVRLRFGAFGPARRVTWYDTTAHLDASTAAELGVGGHDLLPEPGSKAALRDAWIDEHPRLHTAKRTAAAVLGVVVPILLLWLAGRFVLPAIPWPDLPRIPWPDWDLPRIPWPSIDLPSIPWPDWQIDWTPPWWLAWIRDNARYVVPVVVAFVVARSEIRRRRTQRERREAAAARPAEAADRDDASERVDLTHRS
jgi:hypothetical protein